MFLLVLFESDIEVLEMLSKNEKSAITVKASSW